MNPIFPTTLRNTMMKDWKSCQWKAWLTWFHGYRYDDGINEFDTRKQQLQKNTHLHAGAAFAKGCEVVRTNFFIAKRSAEESVFAGVEALLTYYGAHEPFMAPYKNANAMAAALTYFFREAFPLEDETLIPSLPENGSGIEFNFAIPIPKRKGGGFYLHPETGDELLYTGRADQIAYDTIEQEMVVEDDKTTSAVAERWESQWDMESQFRSYAWVLREEGYANISRAVIRGVAIPSSRRKDYDHKEVQVYLTRERVDNWLLNTQLLIEQMLQAYEQKELIKALDAHCAWSGCPFLGECEEPSSVLHQTMGLKYGTLFEGMQILEEPE